MTPDAYRTDDEVETLLSYLQRGRESLVWKLDGLSEYDARRPLTPTGTNLLGLIKHVASTEHGYLSMCLGVEPVFAMPWMGEDAPDNADMWVEADNSREDIVDMYRAAWAADDATVRELGTAATGTVPWWGERGQNVTVHRLLVHVIAETHRHAGHADILREMIDGGTGLSPTNSNLPAHDATWWAEYTAGVERAALAAADNSASTAE